MKTVVATLANEHAIKDLRLLLFTLQLWNREVPDVYIYCDHKTVAEIESMPYDGKKIVRVELDVYTGLDRKTMEKLPGSKYPTLFADFCAEKCRLIRWAAMTAGPQAGVLFCDADICHLGPLPLQEIIASGARLALSPHMIRAVDEMRYGKFNAGYVYLQDAIIADKWLELCATSRFFEQGCLEDLAVWCINKYGTTAVYEFPKTVNYGWWRLLQGTKSVSDQQGEWSIKRTEGYAGIAVGGQPLQSIHTHWFQVGGEPGIPYFNTFVMGFLGKLAAAKVQNTKLLTMYIRGVPWKVQ